MFPAGGPEAPDDAIAASAHPKIAGRIYPKLEDEASGRGRRGRVSRVDGEKGMRELQVVSDGIIDLTEYLRRKEDEPGGTATFALWGAEGERSRFALPLWRTIYLVGGERGGILRASPDEPGGLEPFVVLDLAADPPRTEFDAGLIHGLVGEEVPLVRDAAADGFAVFLGFGSDHLWYLMVEGREGEGALGGRIREDVLFMAGECAGLLFLRELADEELP